MQSKEFKNIKISGLACAVPVKEVETDSFIEYFGADTVGRFKKATGIKARHLSDGSQTASDLCYVAAKALMEKNSLTGEDIDGVIMVTQTPDYKMPSTAYVLHKRLNIKHDCLVFDVNLGCSGFVNGIYILAGLIESGTIDRALLLVGDVNTNHQVSGDTSFTMMFGDAGSACIMERGEEIVRGMIRSDGKGFHTLITPIPGARFPRAISQEGSVESKMDGDDVFLFTITKVPKLFKEFYKEFSCNEEDFDYYMLHQANLMIINQIAKKLKLDSQKIPVSLERYGNTDGASIPVGIVDLCERIKENRTLSFITSGFGIGLSWGIVSFQLDTRNVLPMIFTEEYYEEGRNV